MDDIRLRDPNNLFPAFGSVVSRFYPGERGTFLGKEHDPLLITEDPNEVAATMFHLLGINPHTEMRDSFNRPLPLASGEPILGIVA